VAFLSGRGKKGKRGRAAISDPCAVMQEERKKERDLGEGIAFPPLFAEKST